MRSTPKIASGISHMPTHPPREGNNIAATPLVVAVRRTTPSTAAVVATEVTP